jgi:hypothetical protein
MSIRAMLRLALAIAALGALPPLGRAGPDEPSPPAEPCPSTWRPPTPAPSYPTADAFEAWARRTSECEVGGSFQQVRLQRGQREAVAVILETGSGIPRSQVFLFGRTASTGYLLLGRSEVKPGTLLARQSAAGLELTIRRSGLAGLSRDEEVASLDWAQIDGLLAEAAAHHREPGWRPPALLAGWPGDPPTHP